ncbi:MAG: hypothetical protein RH948_11610 [Cyclobacteriaceae bacterium]
MKKYKIFSILATLSLLIVMACSDEYVLKSPNVNDNVGAVTKVTVNPAKNFFNLTAPSLASEEVEFTLDVDGFGITTVNSVEVELVYTDKDRLYDPFREEKYDSVHSAVTLMTLSTFPSTVVVTGADVAAALGIPIDSLAVGDMFQITLPINTADGRRLTTALGSDLCNEPAQPSFGGCGVAWAISCPSAIPVGTFTATSGGTSADGCPPTNPLSGLSYDITLTDNGAGVYTVSDFSAGVYQNWYGACYGYTFETSISFSDVCNNLTIIGKNDGFSCAIAGSGTYNPATGVITINWSNCFGDVGDWTVDVTP